MQMIRQSLVYQETMNLKAQIENDFMAIRRVLHHFPKLLKDTAFSDFMHAYALVGSRAWWSKKGLSMIPFADFLNHNGVSEADVLCDDDKKCSEVIADRNYAPGEQVLIRYGKFSNATLLLDFGFTLPYNIYDQVAKDQERGEGVMKDQERGEGSCTDPVTKKEWAHTLLQRPFEVVQIQLNIPHHDLLRTTKLELLHKHCTPTIKDVNSFNSSWDSFTIKEVRSSNGKGRGIPQSLRAFARVLCCTSPKELSDLATEAAQNDGRLARHPLNRSREIEAHHILLSRVSQLIEEYNASIEVLGPVSCPSTCSSFSIRSQMARNLLTGELRVLKSAYAWFRYYCATLSCTTD